MRTDIHMTIEVEAPWSDYVEHGASDWQQVTMVWEDKYWTNVAKDDPTNESAQRWAYSVRLLNNRNYRLFAVLGDVRNGSGFAGVDTGDRIEPCIGAGRGLPDDLDPRGDEYRHGEHSFGWATLEELLAYDWGREVVLRGVITEAAYLEGSWRDGGPDEYSGGVSGRDVVTYTEDEYLLRPPNEDARAYIQVEWRSKLSDLVSSFIARLDEINDRIPLSPDRIRLVYGFDS